MSAVFQGATFCSRGAGSNVWNAAPPLSTIYAPASGQAISVKDESGYYDAAYFSTCIPAIQYNPNIVVPATGTWLVIIGMEIVYGGVDCAVSLKKEDGTLLASASGSLGLNTDGYALVELAAGDKLFPHFDTGDNLSVRVSLVGPLSGALDSFDKQTFSVASVAVPNGVNTYPTLTLGAEADLIEATADPAQYHFKRAGFHLLLSDTTVTLGSAGAGKAAEIRAEADLMTVGFAQAGNPSGSVRLVGAALLNVNRLTSTLGFRMYEGPFVGSAGTGTLAGTLYYLGEQCTVVGPPDESEEPQIFVTT